MVRNIKLKIKRLIDGYIRRTCKDEYENPTFQRKNERAVEFSFVFKHLSRICPDNILDVGTGITALPHLIANCGFKVTAVDNIKDYWNKDMFNRHYYIINDDITKTKLNKKFDFITCISVLEHIKNSDSAIRNMFKLLNSKGYIILTCPYKENQYIKNVYDLPGSTYGQNLSFICQSYSRERLNKWLHENGGEIIDQQYWQFWSGDFWTQGDQIIPPVQVKVNQKHQISCILIRKLS
ncbi:MAG: class I SAM-dependent methyltransferase [Bacteroidales bacterium]|nr:class I SAM-dependent methyltransferase [Bacteroidales bacterium]